VARLGLFHAATPQKDDPFSAAKSRTEALWGAMRRFFNSFFASSPLPPGEGQGEGISSLSLRERVRTTASSPLPLPASGHTSRHAPRSVQNHSCHSYDRGSPICREIVPQLSTLNSQLSTLNSQLSTLNSQLSTLNSQLSTLNSQLSTLNSQLSALRAAFPVAGRLPTYAPPRGFCATGADRAACRKLLTAINLRNGSRPARPC